MKYTLLLLLIVVFSCEQKSTNSSSAVKDSVNVAQTPASVNEFLITDTSLGKISKATSFDDLQNIFGKQNMQDTIDFAPEGLDSFIVTKIYSNTPKELIINWQNEKFHKVIGEVNFLQENSPYHTADSLTVGSTLEKLVQVNGKKINFYGTGWDYGGLITSFNKGKFDRSNIIFYLNSRDDAQNVMGDREFNTDLPKVKANLKKVYIARISVLLYEDKK